KHFLHRSEVGPALQEMRGEGMSQEVRMDALRLEARLPGQAAENEEGPGAGQRAAAGIQEELGAVARVEVGPAAGEVPAEGVDGLAADRDDALLGAFADAADDPLLEIDARLVEADRFANAQA